MGPLTAADCPVRTPTVRERPVTVNILSHNGLSHANAGRPPAAQRRSLSLSGGNEHSFRGISRTFLGIGGAFLGMGGTFRSGDRAFQSGAHALRSGHPTFRSDHHAFRSGDSAFRSGDRAFPGGTPMLPRLRHRRDACATLAQPGCLPGRLPARGGACIVSASKSTGSRVGPRNPVSNHGV